EKFIVLLGPSNAYEMPSENACVLVIVPMMMPLPERVEVIVRVLLPVSILPLVIVTDVADTLLLRTRMFEEELLFTVNPLNVVAPETEASSTPMNCTVLVPGVNVPLLIQLPLSECEKVPPSNVTPLEIVRSPFTATAAPALLVPPPDNVRW